MSIARFYTEIAEIHRMSYVGGEGSLALIETINCHMQQSSPEFIQETGGVLGKTFFLYCDSSIDIDTSDTIIINTGNWQGTYSISNKMQYNMSGCNQHLRLTLLKD